MIFQLLFKRSSNNLRSLWERRHFLQFFRKARPGWGKHEQRAKGKSWAMPTPHPHFALASTHLKKKVTIFLQAYLLLTSGSWNCIQLLQLCESVWSPSFVKIYQFTVSLIRSDSVHNISGISGNNLLLLLSSQLDQI